MTIMTDYHEIMDSTQQTNDNIPKETEESVNALIHHMQMENERLRSVNADQMLRIQELSRRAAALCRELESGNGRLSPNRMFHGSPSLLLPSIGSVRNSRVAVNGAGEEGKRGMFGQIRL